MSKKTPYTPPPPVDRAAEAAQREKDEAARLEEIDETRADLAERRKKGRYGTVLTGGQGLQEEAKTKKTVLGG